MWLGMVAGWANIWRLGGCAPLSSSLRSPAAWRVHLKSHWPALPPAGLRAGLAVPPSMLLRPDMRVHKRASDLLAALTAARVDSRATLAAKWVQSPGFLRHELSQCMQKGCAGALLQAWEALRAEAQAAQPATDATAGKKKKKKLRQ